MEDGQKKSRWENTKQSLTEILKESQKNPLAKIGEEIQPDPATELATECWLRRLNPIDCQNIDAPSTAHKLAGPKTMKR